MAEFDKDTVGVGESLCHLLASTTTTMKSHSAKTAHPQIRCRCSPAHFVFILLTTATATLADNSVKLRVAVKGEHSDPRGSVQEVHQRWMEVSATAFHLERPEKIRIEWTLFGDDLAAKKIVKHASGVDTVELAQSQAATIKTKPATFTYTPRHSVKTGSGRRARFKTVEATGIRYHGWAVRAFIGDQLAGEAYSIESIKKLVVGSK